MMPHIFNETTITWLLQLLFCYASVLIMLRFFGTKGVAVLMGVMMIAANIQVLKLFNLPVTHQLLPLGTALMATNYLAADLLTEYYNAKVAKTAINLAIAAFILMFIAMDFTMHFPLLSPKQVALTGLDNQPAIQSALQTLFNPAPKLFICSMVSFWISERLEIFIFSKMKEMFGEKNLWLRNNVSTWVAAMCDNIVFSVLVWRVFTHSPVHWEVLITGYILGTYFVRIFMAILDTPMIYMAKFCLPEKSVETES